MAATEGGPRGRRPGGDGHQPGQGLLPADRAHQARPRALLPGGRRGALHRGRRPADGAQAVRQRRRRGGVLPEAGAGEASGVDRDGRAEVPVRALRARDRRPRRRPAGLGGQPRLRRPAPAPGARRGPAAPRRAAGRPRPDARACRGRRCARWPWSCARCWPTTAWPAGRRRRARAGFHIYCRIAATVDVPRRCAGPRPRWPGRSRSGRRDLATSRWWKEERHGVFVDYNQNAKDRTTAAGYSVRPTPDARVSDAAALGRGARLRPGRRSPSTPCRPGCAELGDPGAGIDDAVGSLDVAARAGRPAREAGLPERTGAEAARSRRPAPGKTSGASRAAAHAPCR